MMTLEDLPLDILFEVVQRLDFPSVLALSRSNRAFHASLDPIKLTPEYAKRDFFLRAERFSQHEHPPQLACFSCWRILPRECFGDGERSGRKGKHAAEDNRKRYGVRRFCWTCGARKRLYPEGRALRKGKYLWYLCYTCGEYRTRSQRCEKVTVMVAATAANGTAIGETVSTCSGAMLISAGKTALAPLPDSMLEQLPMALRKEIISHLDYPDTLTLAQVNRHFHATVNPIEAGTLRSRMLFVRARYHEYHARAEHRPRVNPAPDPDGELWDDDFRPCFCCAILKSRARFTRDQWSLGTSEQLSPLSKRRPRGPLARLYRRCKACLHALRAPSTPAEVALRDEWYRRRRALCRFCGHPSYADELSRAGGGCEECDARGLLAAGRQVRDGRRRAREEGEASGDDALDGLGAWFAQAWERADRFEEARRGSEARAVSVDQNSGHNMDNAVGYYALARSTERLRSLVLGSGPGPSGRRLSV